MTPAWRRILIVGGFVIGIAVVALLAIIAYALVSDDRGEPVAQVPQPTQTATPATVVASTTVVTPTPTPFSIRALRPTPKPPPYIRVGQVSGLEFTDECWEVLAEPAARDIGLVHDCYYFGTGDVYELVPTLDTCEELEAFANHPTDLHRLQAVSEVWLAKYYDECPHELPEPYDPVGEWLKWETEERQQWCADAPDFANLSWCMATGLKAWP